MIPLFTTEQIRNADKYAIEQLKVPGIVLMENAALSILNLIKRNFKYTQGILTLLDGSKGLGKAVDETFGKYALVQRCYR